MIIIIAVATPFKIEMILRSMPTQAKIKDTTYKSATATSVYILILLRPQKPERLEDELEDEDLLDFDDFVEFAIVFSSFKQDYTHFKDIFKMFLIFLSIFYDFSVEYKA